MKVATFINIYDNKMLEDDLWTLIGDDYDVIDI